MPFRSIFSNARFRRASMNRRPSSTRRRLRSCSSASAVSAASAAFRSAASLDGTRPPTNHGETPHLTHIDRETRCTSATHKTTSCTRTRTRTCGCVCECLCLGTWQRVRRSQLPAIVPLPPPQFAVVAADARVPGPRKHAGVVVRLAPAQDCARAPCTFCVPGQCSAQPARYSSTAVEGCHRKLQAPAQGCVGTKRTREENKNRKQNEKKK